jgi:L-seryl-tRNA(Ser) seleniumtransferase
MMDTPGTLSLPEMAEIGRRYDLPVIVDASAALPPRGNLHRFIAEGADLVTFSGGKAIGGPQASGILAGRIELIESVALQHQDMDVRAETWTRRASLAEGRLRGIPHHGIGRAMKVGREEIAGLIVALERYVAGDDNADATRWRAMLDQIAEGLADLPGVCTTVQLRQGQPLPQLWIDLHPQVAGLTGYEAVNALLEGTPAVAVSESRAEFDTLIVNPMVLTEDEAEIVGERLRAVLSRAGG